MPSPGQAPLQERGNLNAAYESRWYMIRGLEAGDDVTVTLKLPSNFEFDYTLLGFVDVRRIANKLASQAGLTIPNASPTPAPLATAGTTPGLLDADDMDSDDMDSDDMDSDDMDSDDMDSDDMDSDDMDSDDMDSDDMDSDDMDSGDWAGGDPDAYRDVYSRAQRHALRSASVTPGPANEQIHMIARTGGDDLYFRVRGHEGAYSPGASGEYVLEVIVKPNNSCVGVPHDAVRPVLNANFRTRLAGKSVLVLTNTSVKSLALSNVSAFTELLNKLGAVYDVQTDGDEQLKSLYSAWASDAGKKCVPLANAIVDSLRSVVRDSATLLAADKGALKYVVIAGADDVIPFARVEDRAEISREWVWGGPYEAGQPLGASLTFGTYLSDDPYGRTRGALDVRGMSVRAPDIAVGRLVETAADISTYVGWFLGEGSAGIVVRKALVSGYTFVSDLADNIKNAFGAITVDSDLIYDPEPPRSASYKWTATDLAGKLTKLTSFAGTQPKYAYNGPYQLIAAQGHYSGNSLLPPDDGIRLHPSDAPVGANNDLAGALWMTIGCHSAHDIVDLQVRADLDADKVKSWAETLLRQKATLVGGTGYQYADSTITANSELLYSYLAQEIGTNASQTVGIGDLLLRAKRRYLRERFQTRGIDQKVVEVSTIYGIPMLSVRSEKVTALPTTSPTVKPSASTTAAPSVVERSFSINYSFDPLNTKSKGSYLSVSNQSIGRPLRPVLPAVFRDVTFAGEFPVGAIWTGASFVDGPFTPLIGEPDTEERLAPDKKPRYQNRAFLPARPFRIARTGGEPRQHTLVFAPWQYNATNSTGRQWNGPADFTLFYASKRDKSALRAAPRIQDPRVFIGSNNKLNVALSLRHYESKTETLRAFASYLDPGTKKMATVTLTAAPTSTQFGATFRREFSGVLSSAPPTSSVFFQAMGGNGRVSMHTNGGRLFVAAPAGTPTPTPKPAATRLTITPLTNTALGYRDRIAVSAQLSYASGNAPVADVEVLFRLAGSRIWAKTNSSGFANVMLTVNARPRDNANYLVVASWPGNDKAGPSAGSLAVTVARASTHFTPAVAVSPTRVALASSGRTDLGTLTGTSRGRPLADRPMFVRRRGKDGNWQGHVVYTDASQTLKGHLLISRGDIGLPAGEEDAVEVWFAGDERYFGTDATSKDDTPVRTLFSLS